MSTHHRSTSSAQADVVTEAEHLLDRLADSDAVNGKAIAAKVREAVDTLKEKAAVAKVAVKERMDQTESAIKHHPWTSVGVAAGIGIGVGLLVGYLAARRGD